MKDLMKEAIIIPTLSLFGYMVAFSYQAGYFSYYHIPYDLIEVNLTNTLIAITALFFVLWPIISFLNIFSLMGLFKEDTALKRVLVRNFIAFMPVIIFSYFFSSYKMVIYAILVILFSYGMATICGGFKGKGIEEKLLHQEAVERELDKNDLILKFANNVGMYNFRLLLIVFMVLGLTYSYSYSVAKNTKEYRFLADAPQIAIIKIYSDNLIALKVNEESKTFTDNLILINRNNDIPFNLVTKDIGKLTYYLK